MPLWADADFTATVSNGQLLVSWITNTESNNSHFDIEVSTDGKVFKKAGTVISKAPDGNSTSQLKYTFSISLDKALLLGFGGLLPLLFLPAFKDKSRKYIIGATIILTGLFIFNSGCKKMDLSQDDAGKKVFVRIVQVDKDGTKREHLFHRGNASGISIPLRVFPQVIHSFSTPPGRKRDRTNDRNRRYRTVHRCHDRRAGRDGLIPAAGLFGLWRIAARSGGLRHPARGHGHDQGARARGGAAPAAAHGCGAPRQSGCGATARAARGRLIRA